MPAIKQVATLSSTAGPGNGYCVDANSGEAIPGVSILVKGNKRGVITVSMEI
jgi:hypothetical protein